jgi:hypothetical protein
METPWGTMGRPRTKQTHRDVSAKPTRPPLGSIGSLLRDAFVERTGQAGLVGAAVGDVVAGTAQIAVGFDAAVADDWRASLARTLSALGAEHRVELATCAARTRETARLARAVVVDTAGVTNIADDDAAGLATFLDLTRKQAADRAHQRIGARRGADPVDAPIHAAFWVAVTAVAGGLGDADPVEAAAENDEAVLVAAAGVAQLSRKAATVVTRMAAVAVVIDGAVGPVGPRRARTIEAASTATVVVGRARIAVVAGHAAIVSAEAAVAAVVVAAGATERSRCR